jgi:SH3 domain protein
MLIDKQYKEFPAVKALTRFNLFYNVNENTKGIFNMSTLRLKFIFTISVFFLSLYGFILIPTAMAGIQYVSDLLIISVKDGQDADAPVIGYLRSAAPVDVLQETEELMQIRSEDGTHGWVRKKFIVAEKPKAVIIGELEEKIAMLEENTKTLQQGSDAQELQKMIDGYKQKIATLTASIENEKRTRLALQKDLKQINVKYQQLLSKGKKNAGINKELAALKNENKTLKDKIAAQPPAKATPMLSGNIKWFLIGGGVLLFGFIIGRAIRGKRSYRY